MNIIFNVIMPCYNSQLYVKDAVESLLSQTYPNWELIAVNDGSTDDTLDILNEFAAKDKRIKVYTKANGGYASAVNYGLDKISGDYFLFMGSDDRLANTLFFEIEKHLNGNKPDMIGFRTIRCIDGIMTGLDQFTKFYDNTYLDCCSINEYERKYPLEAEIFCVRDTSKCYRSDIIGNLRYFGKYGYDSDGIFSMLFAHKANSFCNVPTDGYYWTLRSDSVSAKTNTSIDIDRMNNWWKYFNIIYNENFTTLLNKEEFYLKYYYGLLCSIIKYKNVVNKKEIYKARTLIIELLQKYNLLDTFFNNKIKKIIFLRVPLLWYIYNYIWR